ncbi:MAG TPA: methyltransferase domain-containing protein [Acidimicrobiales bacterium]|nr:methyltransferase domain-containing protein [Acidimicrobiales bacterium]
MATFDQLVAEAVAAPIEGWDFGWLDGRATEERPSWGYAGLVAERAADASRMLDIQSGGGELLAGLPAFPQLLVASEGWPPNLEVAAARLRPLGGQVVAAHDDRPALPFADDSFDLITSRHPVTTWWDEIARVMAPGGTYLSQEVGPHSLRELREFFLGPQPPGSRRDPDLARRNAETAGLVVEDLQEARLCTTFDDVGAVVYFLRLVVWIVPGFTVERYRDRLRALHEEIGRNGQFRATATRFLIRASKPG